MKRVALLFTAALMVLSFGLANAQDVVTLSADGTWDGGAKVSPNKDITWTIGFVVGTDVAKGGTNGFEIFVADAPGSIAGAYTFEMIDTTTGSQSFTVLNDMSAWWDGGFFYNGFSPTGSGADTIGFGGFSLFKPGIPLGTYDMYTITTSVDASVAGKYLCIDSCFYPPGGPWLWSTNSGDIFPTWEGPYCYLIEAQPNVEAEFVNFPTTALSGDHCVTFTKQFEGTDPDPLQCDPPGNGSVVFSLVDDGGLAGATMSAGGMFSYMPTLANVGPSYTVTVRVEDACGAGTDATFDISFTNVAPTIACDIPKTVGAGKVKEAQIVGDDVDCDAGTYSIVSVTPTPVGTYVIDPNDGLLTFTTDLLDADIVYTFVVEYSDGNLGATCEQVFNVVGKENYGVYITKTHETYQGGHEYVDVNVFKGSEEMWGFDMLIAYDASALSFQGALEGTIYSLCGWEYFTYRYGADGNCSGGCPSGLLRVVGIAETNNGANHPTCYTPAGEFTLFSMDFLVSDDRTLECQYVPIRFFWMDCGDNSISFHPSDAATAYEQRLAVSANVYEMAFTSAGEFDEEEGILIEQDPATVFPTYTGVIPSCFDVSEVDKDVPEALIDFYNGGIDIACADSIDARGDINLNGQSYEISDAVLYSNYFVFGIGVFTHYQAQVAASDVNADGIPLSVGDLVYLIRVVVGDALPYPKVAPVTASVTYDGSEISVSDKMGAAYVVIDGQATPTLLVDNMEMKYAFDANENVTRVLVYSTIANQTFQGAFLDADGSVNYVEMATYEGTPVQSVVVPANFSLSQNYPNPFNPSTTVEFALPTAGDYTLTVYNVTGQQVMSISDRADAGIVTQTIDLSAQASGVYFYNVTTANDSQTRKMVLLK